MLFLRLATATGINFPVFASRPILLMDFFFILNSSSNYIKEVCRSGIKQLYSTILLIHFHGGGSIIYLLCKSNFQFDFSGIFRVKICDTMKCIFYPDRRYIPFGLAILSTHRLEHRNLINHLASRPDGLFFYISLFSPISSILSASVL